MATTIPYYLSSSGTNGGPTGISLERDARFRSCCNTCHVTHASRIIAYIQITLSVCALFMIVVMLMQSSPQMRTEFMNDYYFGRNGVKSKDNVRTWGGKMDNSDTMGDLNIIGQEDIVIESVKVDRNEDALENERREFDNAIKEVVKERQQLDNWHNSVDDNDNDDDDDSSEDVTTTAPATTEEVPLPPTHLRTKRATYYIAEVDYSSQFATLVGAMIVLTCVELLISVCLLLAVRLERRWLMLPHLITSLLTLISSIVRLIPWMCAADWEQFFIGIFTIVIELLFFWIPYRCFIYFREKERLGLLHWQQHQQRVAMFDGIVGNSDLPPPPSYAAAYSMPSSMFTKAPVSTIVTENGTAAGSQDIAPPPSYSATVVNENQHNTNTTNLVAKNEGSEQKD